MTDPTTLPRCDEFDEERLREVYARHQRAFARKMRRAGKPTGEQEWLHEGPDVYCYGLLWKGCMPVEGVRLVKRDGYLGVENDTTRAINLEFGEGTPRVVWYGPERPPPAPTRLGLALVRLRRALLRWLE